MIPNAYTIILITLSVCLCQCVSLGVPVCVCGCMSVNVYMCAVVETRKTGHSIRVGHNVK